MSGIIRATIIAVVGSAALASSASASGCPETPSSQAFALWGDTAEYSRLPGGEFDSTTYLTKVIPNGWLDARYGWQLLGGAKPVYDQDPYQVGGPSARSYAVELPRGSSLVSSQFCVDRARPYYRFMLRPTPDAVAPGNVFLGVQPEYLAPDGTWKPIPGNPQSAPVGVWGPSKAMYLIATLPASSLNQTTWQMRLRFWSLVSAGAVRIDNVMVDPYRSR